MNKKLDNNLVEVTFQSKGHYDGTLAALPLLKAKLLNDLMNEVLRLPTAYIEEQNFNITFSSEFKHANEKVKYDHTIITATYTENVDKDIYEKFIKGSWDENV